MMHAYDDLDGVPCVASRELLTTILRERVGLRRPRGVRLHGHRAAGALAPAWSSDLADGGPAWRSRRAWTVDLPTTVAYGAPLADAIAAGDVDVALVDQAVRRTLREKVTLGLFEQPYVDVDAPELTGARVAEDRALARQLARRSIVLLRNEGVLPLAAPRTHRGHRAQRGQRPQPPGRLQPPGAHREPHRGAHARALRGRLGPRRARASSGLLAGHPHHPRRDPRAGGRRQRGALRARLRPDGRHGRGARRGRRGGERRGRGDRGRGRALGLTDDCQSGEARDRLDLGLPGRQSELVAAVVATGTPVVLVLVSGRPLAIAAEAASCAAIVHAWVPGDDGAGRHRGRAVRGRVPGRQAAR